MKSIVLVTLFCAVFVNGLPQFNYNTNRHNYNHFPAQPLHNNPNQQPNQQQFTQPQKQIQQYVPQQSKYFVPITSYNNELASDGSFSYGYSTADGQQAQAQGFIRNLGNKDLETQVVQGSYSYTSPDGTPINVRYIADENGYRAEGAHLPTPPPIPEAIAKALQYIARAQANNPSYRLNQQYPGNDDSGIYNNKLG